MKAKKPIDRLRQLLPKNLTHHQFLVLVCSATIGIFSFQQIFSSNTAHQLGGLGSGATESGGYLAPGLKKTKKHLALPQSTPVAPILAWHGPIQPIQIAPGSAPFISSIPTTEPVVFVTIDDGWVQTPENHQWLEAHHLPFSLFLSDAGIRNNYQYFQDLQNAGMTVEDHSVNHPSFLKLNQPNQQAEICGAADVFQNVFHHRPTLFRPPYGSTNAFTQPAVATCGIKATIMWRAVAQNGALQYQDSKTGLEPGDIVLTHFEPDLIANMQALSAELNRQHLQVAHLEDWLQ